MAGGFQNLHIYIHKYVINTRQPRILIEWIMNQKIKFKCVKYT